MTNREYEKAVRELTQRWIKSKEASAKEKGLILEDVDVSVYTEYAQTLGDRQKRFFVTGGASQCSYD